MRPGHMGVRMIVFPIFESAGKNIFVILQNMFMWNNDITNILNLKLRAGIYAGYMVLA
jgi:hypothetical protein